MSYSECFGRFMKLHHLFWPTPFLFSSRAGMHTSTDAMFDLLYSQKHSDYLCVIPLKTESACFRLLGQELLVFRFLCGPCLCPERWGEVEHLLLCQTSWVVQASDQNAFCAPPLKVFLSCPTRKRKFLSKLFFFSYYTCFLWKLVALPLRFATTDITQMFMLIFTLMVLF